MRSCDAVGIQDIHVLNSRIPPHRSWGHKSSSGAADWVTVHQYTDALSCFEVLRKQYGRIFATRLTAGSVPLLEMDFTRPVALVFGNEHDGVSPEVEDLADGHFLIPQVGMIQSLNISVACAVTLYEAFRQKSLAGHYNRRSLGDSRYQVLLQHWSRERPLEIKGEKD